MKLASQWIAEHSTKLIIIAAFTTEAIILLCAGGCHWPGVDNPEHKVHYPAEQWHTPINTNAP